MIAASLKKSRARRVVSVAKPILKVASEIDLEEEFRVLPNRYSASDRSYGFMMKRFMVFCEVGPDNAICPKEVILDENVAKFLVELGKGHDYHPSAKKKFMAGVGSLCERYAMPNIFDHKHEWPKTMNAISVWKAAMKNHPHYPQKAGQFDFAAIKSILSLKAGNVEEIRDIAIVVAGIFMGKRADDMVHWFSKNTNMVQANEENPRRFVFVQTISKVNRNHKRQKQLSSSYTQPDSQRYVRAHRGSNKCASVHLSCCLEGGQGSLQKLH
jgi:hypothetical protein